MKEENKTGEFKLALQRLSAARTETSEMEARDFYVNRTEYEMRPCGAEHENARKPAKPDTKPFRVLHVFRGSIQTRQFGRLNQPRNTRKSRKDAAGTFTTELTEARFAGH